jgi:hypothetical protein
MFEIITIRLLCAILDCLLFPNIRNPQDIRDKHLLLSDAQTFTAKLERERIIQDE